jgi:DNA (cytosine-5)-methyltransferase 1
VNYYNEIDPYAAQWLRNLISAGHIPPGDVDERSIVDVQPGDLVGYTQCHFFAGIGGWSLALRLAGWPDSRPAWTGSCPCQPFSAAGKQKGEADSRHLWPEFRRLIAECAPPVVFGEQVASALGRTWLGGVRTDLEALGYAVGAADLCAASVGAPHIRQRLWWVADAGRIDRAGRGTAGIVAGSPRALEGQEEERERLRNAADDGGAEGRMGDPERWRREGGPDCRTGAKESWTGCHADQSWGYYELVPCGDGKTRLLKPGIEPLAHGVPNRVGRLRAYGNAIVPQVAAEFVKAYCE